MLLAKLLEASSIGILMGAMISDSAVKKAEEFLRVAHDFHLGDLPTESRHPLTYELADLSQNNIPEALKILKNIEIGVVEKIIAREEQIQALANSIHDCLSRGHRVFIYGCGATGRLALSLEYLWRFVHEQMPDRVNRVTGFMSGGDLALIHSIEHFEDHPEWGARQLKEIGFHEGDLLVSCTEGGETPSVIGATEEAIHYSSRSPWFLYCNPDDVLRTQVERSRKVLTNPLIHKLNLYVGPMSISGSTRLQATTALMLALGSAMLRDSSADFPRLDFVGYVEFLKNLDLNFLQAFVEKESAAYHAQEHVIYETQHYGIPILTDTTERSPTFSLPGFENLLDAQKKHSLCYLSIPTAKTAKEAWKKVLLREPKTLEWTELSGLASSHRLHGFDFSYGVKARRESSSQITQRVFSIDRIGNSLKMQFEDQQELLDISSLHPLCEHVFLKFLLNVQSALVMGRIGRFESNVMTWVKPSNRKLIDRAIRYVEYLLIHNDITNYSYKEIAHQLFAEREHLKPDESVVLKTVESFKARLK